MVDCRQIHDRLSALAAPFRESSAALILALDIASRHGMIASIWSDPVSILTIHSYIATYVYTISIPYTLGNGLLAAWTYSCTSFHRTTGCSKAAKCAPSVCLLDDTTLATFFTNEIGVGMISPMNWEYPTGFEMYSGYLDVSSTSLPKP